MGAVWVLKAVVESILMGIVVDKGTSLSLKVVDHFTELPTVQQVRTSCIELYSRRTPAIKDSLAYVNREARTFLSLCILLFRCIWERLFSISPPVIQRSTESLYKLIGGINPSIALTTCLLRVAIMLYGGNSGDMMRAPGRPGQFVKRAIFEADPNTYFRKLHGKL